MKKVQVGVTKTTEKPPTVSREYHDHMVGGLQGTIDELKKRLERQARAIASLHDKIKMVHTLLDIKADSYEIHNNSIYWSNESSDPKHDSRIAKMLRKSIDDAKKRAESFTDNLSKASSVTVAKGAWSRQEPVSFGYGCVCTLRESCPNCAPDSYDGPNFFTRNED